MCFTYFRKISLNKTSQLSQKNIFRSQITKFLYNKKSSIYFTTDSIPQKSSYFFTFPTLRVFHTFFTRSSFRRTTLQGGPGDHGRDSRGGRDPAAAVSDRGRPPGQRALLLDPQQQPRRRVGGLESAAPELEPGVPAPDRRGLWHARLLGQQQHWETEEPLRVQPPACQ